GGGGGPRGGPGVRGRAPPRYADPVPAVRQHRGPPADDDHPRRRRPPHALDVREQLGAGELLPLPGRRPSARLDGGPEGGAVGDRARGRLAEHAVRHRRGLRGAPEHPGGAPGGGHGGRRVAGPDARPRDLPLPPPPGALRPHHPVDGRLPRLRPGVRHDGRRPGRHDPDHHLLQLRDGLPAAQDGARLRPRRHHAPPPVAGHRALDLSPLPPGEGGMVSRRARDPRRILGRACVYVALLVVVAVSLFPIYFALTTSLKPTREAFTSPPTWLFTPTLEHHRFIWLETPLPRYLVNTLIITTGTVLLSIPLGCMAAYYLARYRSRPIQVLLFTLLAVRAFPRILLLVPFFLLARAAELYDTHLVIILIIVAFNQP